MWLQQTCTLFIQSGVQLLPGFTQLASEWANSSVVRTNFSQPNQTHSQLERAGHQQGNRAPLGITLMLTLIRVAWIPQWNKH